MSNIKFTMKDLDGTVMPYTSFVISTSASANAASFTTNLNGEATVTLAAVSTPYYISKQDGTTESVIAYKFFVPDTTYTLDAELLFVDMGKISKDRNDKSIAALIEAKVVAVNAANRALQVVSLLGDVSTIRTNLTNLVQVASNIPNINAVNSNATNINTVASNTTNINKVATIDTSITTVANSQANVNTVATNIASVNTVAPHTANIGTVATNVGSINTVSGSIASVNTTASNIANVNTVASNTSNISSVAGIIPAVSTVANNIADIQTTAEGIGLIPDVIPYTSNIATVANNIAPIVAVGNNINNINEVRAMEADIEVLADEIANIAGAAAAVTQAVDAQKVLYVAGTDYTKNTSNTLVLPYLPAKSNSVKIFFDGSYINKDSWTRVGSTVAFPTAINADKVEIQYEVPSSFVGLSPEDILVIQNAEAAAQASEVDAQQSATAAAVSASLAQGVANQAVDAIKQLFVAGTHFTKNVSTQLTMDFLPVKTNAVKVFFDGVYQNKNTFTRLGKVLTFNEAINVDNVEIHYEVPSQFVGLDDDDNAVLVAAQNAAQASANAAAASFDSFDDRYLGAKSVAPTVDNDGNALLVGAKYFNSTENKMYVRNSSNAWQLDTADSSTVNYDGGTVQDVLDAVTGPNGAASVGYMPAGVGAVATTVQSKLREFVNVMDYGATGNGVADDRPALIAAAAYCVSSGKGLYCPPGYNLFLGSSTNLKGVKNINIESNIVIPSGTLTVGGNTNVDKFVINLVSVTNGASTLTSAPPASPVVRVAGVMNSNITIGSCNYIQLYADATVPAERAVAYNQIQLPGSVSLLEITDSGVAQSYVNENSIYATRIIRYKVTGIGYGHNHNKLFHPCMEGNTVLIQFSGVGVSTNHVYGARFEDVAASPGVVFSAGTYSNTVVSTWSGTGTPRNQFAIPIPVVDSGSGNMVTTESAFTFTRNVLFSINPNTIIASAPDMSVAQSPRITPSNQGVDNLTGRQVLIPGLAGVTSVYGFRYWALTELIPVELGDTVVWEFDFAGSKVRPTVFVYDENMKPLLSEGAGGAFWSQPDMTFNATYGRYTTGSDLTAAGCLPGAVARSEVKYIRVGVYSSGFVKNLTAVLYTQCIGRASTKGWSAQNYCLQSINATPTRGYLPLSYMIYETTGNAWKRVTFQYETGLSGALVAGNTSVTVAAISTVANGDIVGILLDDLSTHWATVSGLSGSTFTIAAIPVGRYAPIGGRIVFNRWA